MQVKSEQEQLKEANYQEIERQRKAYAGSDVFTVVVGNEVVAIGLHQRFLNCKEFLLNELRHHPRRIVKQGQFDDLINAYDFVLDNDDSEAALEDFLSDAYEGLTMNDYD